MEKYVVGKIITINNIDFNILSIIEYKSNTYILAMEYVKHSIPDKPKIVLLQQLEKTDSKYGTHLKVVNDKDEIKNVLKQLEKKQNT